MKKILEGNNVHASLGAWDFRESNCLREHTKARAPKCKKSETRFVKLTKLFN